MGVLVPLTGVSCSGQTTLQNRIIGEMHACRVVTYTSRPQRDGEINGVHYHFRTKQLIKALPDPLWIHEHYGHVYSGRQQHVRDAVGHHDVSVITITPDCHEPLQAMFPDITMLPIHLLKPADGILRHRLYERGTPESDIDLRINESKLFEETAATVPGLHFIKPGTPDEVFTTFKQLLATVR